MKRQLEDDIEQKPDSKIIRINAGGGPILMTTLNTLTRVFPQSVIARQFSRLENVPRDDEGNYFIDTDPVHFRAMLNVLRRPDLVDVVPHNIDEQTWWSTLDYWGIKPFLIDLEEDEVPLYCRASRENAMKLYKCEYAIAKKIVEGFDFAIKPRETKVSYQMIKDNNFVHNNLSGELIRKKVTPEADVTPHYELTTFILDRVDRFEQYFRKLVPTHRVVIKSEQRDNKPAVAFYIDLIFDETVLEKVCEKEKKING